MVKSAFVAGSTTLSGDVFHLLVRTIGEIAGVWIGSHVFLISRQSGKFFALN